MTIVRGIENDLPDILSDRVTEWWSRVAPSIWFKQVLQLTKGGFLRWEIF